MAPRMAAKSKTAGQCITTLPMQAEARIQDGRQTLWLVNKPVRIESVTSNIRSAIRAVQKMEWIPRSNGLLGFALNTIFSGF